MDNKSPDITYINYKQGDEELVRRLVDDHRAWALSVAKVVARAWHLNYHLETVDGGALEALLFCAHRFDPSQGVPFRAYARRRIYEGCSTEARTSKTWQVNSGVNDNFQENTRISRIFSIYPELNDDLKSTQKFSDIGIDESSSDKDEEHAQKKENRYSIIRAITRSLKMSAGLIALARDKSKENTPETNIDFRKIENELKQLCSVHQNILWYIYWRDYSLRMLAREWDINELVVTREHLVLMNYLERISNAVRNKSDNIIENNPLKLRPKLRPIDDFLKTTDHEFPFGK